MPQIQQEKPFRIIMSGLLVTTTAIVFSSFVPFICFLALPQAGLFVQVRFGKQNAVTIALLSTVIIGLVTQGNLIDLFFFSGLLFSGMTMGYCYQRNRPVEWIVLAATMVALFCNAAGVYLYSNQVQSDVAALVNQHIGNSLTLTLKWYESIGMPQESIQAFSENFDQIQHDLVILMPSIITSLTLVMIWLNLLLGKTMKQYSGLSRAIGKLNLWKAPEHLVWGVIGCVILLLLSNSGWRLLGISGLFILMTVYYFQGMAIVSYFFEKKGFPRLLKIVLYSFIAVQQLLLFVIIGIGFFDIWLNFRKLEQVNEAGE